MNEKEKTTVPIPPVGADGEQSLSYVISEKVHAIVNNRIQARDIIQELSDRIIL